MKELMFQSNTLYANQIDGELWVGAADIAKALGYARIDQVTRIYDRHAIEFNDDMTRLVMLPDLDRQIDVPGQSRIRRVFSLRGAHLVAMFSRTSKGQDFRRRVLDLIQKEKSKEKSLLTAYYEALAHQESQAKFATICGRGLNEHKSVMPPLRKKVDELLNLLQPSLLLEPAH